MKAINIKWDTDGNEGVLKELPTEMKIPMYLYSDLYSDVNVDVYEVLETISDWLSDQTGFCHFGFELVEEN